MFTYLAEFLSILGNREQIIGNWQQVIRNREQIREKNTVVHLRIDKFLQDFKKSWNQEVVKNDYFKDLNNNECTILLQKLPDKSDTKPK